MISIDKEVEDIVPREFKELKDILYTLTKIEQKNPSSRVAVGHSITGKLSVVCVPITELAHVRIDYDWGYMRTSPIIKVVDKTLNHIILETEGGVYRLEWS